MARPTPKTTKMPKEFEPRFIEDLDHRHAIAKEVRRRYEVLRNDVGADQSAQRDMLCRRAVFMGVCLETMEHEGLSDGNFDSGKYTQMVNSLIGLLRVLGLDKKPQAATDLTSYLEGKKKKP